MSFAGDAGVSFFYSRSEALRGDGACASVAWIGPAGAAFGLTYVISFDKMAQQLENSMYGGKEYRDPFLEPSAFNNARGREAPHNDDALGGFTNALLIHDGKGFN